MNKKEKKNEVETGTMRTRKRSVPVTAAAIAAIALAVLLTVFIMPKADISENGPGKEDDAVLGSPGETFSLNGITTINGNGLVGVTVKYTIDGGEEKAVVSRIDGTFAIEAPAGSVITVTEVSKKDFTTEGEPKTEFIMSEDIYAEFPVFYDAENWSMIIIDPNNGEDYYVFLVERGKTIPVPEDPKMHMYVISGWHWRGSEWDFANPVTEDSMIIYAEYTYDTEYWFVVTFDPNNYTPSWTDHVSKDDPYLKRPWYDPKFGSFAFEGWFMDGAEWNFGDPVRSHMTLTAEYDYDAEEWFFVTFESEGTWGFPMTVAVSRDDPYVMKPKDPYRSAYIFDAWHYNGEEWDFGAPIEGNMTLVAQYVRDMRYWALVTFDPDNGDEAAEVWVEKYETVPRPADPEKFMHAFVGWFVNGYEWDFGMYVRDDLTLKAQYRNHPASWAFVIATSNEGGSFEYRINGEGPFLPSEGTLAILKGKMIEIKAVPDDGYVFIWDDGTPDGIVKFTVLGDKHLSGVFAIPATQMTDAEPSLPATVMTDAEPAIPATQMTDAEPMIPATQMTDSEDVPPEIPAAARGGVPVHAALLLALLFLSAVFIVALLREEE